MGTDRPNSMHDVVARVVLRRYLDKSTNGAALDNSTADFEHLKALWRGQSRDGVKGGFPASMPVWDADFCEIHPFSEVTLSLMDRKAARRLSGNSSDRNRSAVWDSRWMGR
jgi:hypothetical protein